LTLDLSSAALTSPQYFGLISKIQQIPVPDLQVVEGKIYKKVEFSSGDPDQEASSWRLWVPDQLHVPLIKQAHDPPLSAHGGIHKTLTRLREWFC